MYKKIVAGALAFALVFGIGGTLGGVDKGVFAVNASAEEEMPTSGKCGENLTWKLDADGTLTISGTGRMTDYDFNNSPFWGNLNIKKIVFAKGIESVGRYSFLCCFNLTEVIMSDTIAEVQYCAFKECKNLSEIAMSKTIKYIDGGAFSNTKWLEEQESINKLVIINNIVIDGQDCEEKLIIPDNINLIANSALCGFKTLKNVEIGSGVKTIDAFSFSSCINLESVSISSGVETIDSYAFCGCTKLKNIVIPNNVKNIGVYSLGYTEGDYGANIKIENFTISGYKNSAAEKYAKDNGFKFIELKKTVSVGDANGDNEINVSDIAVSAAHIKGIKPLTDEQQKAADVNDDDKVNVTDIAMIASHIKGIKALK